MNPLDDLLSDSLTRQPQKRAKNAGDGPERHVSSNLRELWNNPENWKRTKGVALMHVETQTLLGNFSEYLHVRVRNCRRLVRESEPLLISATEWVSGPQWVEWADETLAAERWTETLPAVLDIHLPELGVRAMTVAVMATLAHGGISKVTLTEDTHFHSDDRRSALFLPKGLSILAAMSFDTKLALRAEMGL